MSLQKSHGEEKLESWRELERVVEGIGEKLRSAQVPRRRVHGDPSVRAETAASHARRVRKNQGNVVMCQAMRAYEKNLGNREHGCAHALMALGSTHCSWILATCQQDSKTHPDHVWNCPVGIALGARPPWPRPL